MGKKSILRIIERSSGTKSEAETFGVNICFHNKTSVLFLCHYINSNTYLRRLVTLKVLFPVAQEALFFR